MCAARSPCQRGCFPFLPIDGRYKVTYARDEQSHRTQDGGQHKDARNDGSIICVCGGGEGGGEGKVTVCTVGMYVVDKRTVSV